MLHWSKEVPHFHTRGPDDFHILTYYGKRFGAIFKH